MTSKRTTQSPPPVSTDADPTDAGSTDGDPTDGDRSPNRERTPVSSHDSDDPGRNDPGRPDDVIDPARERTRVGALAVLAAGVGFYYTLGVAGVLVGSVLAVCWYRYSAEATFALGTVLLAVTVPDAAPVGDLALVVGGLLAVLASTLFRYASPGRLLGAFCLAFAAVYGLSWAGVEWIGAIWIGAFLSVLAVSTFAYGLHRYALVRLSLVGEGASS